MLAVQITGFDFWSIFTTVTGIVTLLGGILAWLAYVVSVRESEDDVHNEFEVFFNKFEAEGRYEPYQKMLGISIGEPESLAVDLDERPVVLIVDKVVVKQDQGLWYRLRRRFDPRANVKGELELQTRLNPNNVFEHWGVESTDPPRWKDITMLESIPHLIKAVPEWPVPVGHLTFDTLQTDEVELSLHLIVARGYVTTVQTEYKFVEAGLAANPPWNLVVADKLSDPYQRYN